MREDTLRELKNGLNTAFIDEGVASNLAYKPQFISNNYKEGRKVLSSIEDELLACEQFSISVAFITTNGITPLLQTLKELEEKNIPRRILTTDYLNFSDPKALQKLEELQNIELRMFCAREAGMGFHTKGYIFEKDEMYRIIVGSSNMTLSALTRNKEWNTRIVSTSQGEYAREIVDEFETLWNSGFSKRYDEFEIIVIDEVHRAGAESYQRIMKYFEPTLWLGMTASPDRTDGFDIYRMFDHNIAYEIRL